jgi:hypothetical protein
LSFNIVLSVADSGTSFTVLRVCMSRYFDHRRRHADSYNRRHEDSEPAGLADPGSTGSEAPYFRSFVDSHKQVTVVLTSGERLQGKIRYYDHSMFSLGPADGSPKIFLLKSSVLYISEE